MAGGTGYAVYRTADLRSRSRWEGRPQGRWHHGRAGPMLYNCATLAGRSYERDPETRGCAGRQEIRRLVLQRHGDARSAQFMLARAPALRHGFAFRDADSAATRRGHAALPAL